VHTAVGYTIPIIYTKEPLVSPPTPHSVHQSGNCRLELGMIGDKTAVSPNRISAPSSPNRISLCSKPDFRSERTKYKRPLDIRLAVSAIRNTRFSAPRPLLIPHLTHSDTYAVTESLSPRLLASSPTLTCAPFCPSTSGDCCLGLRIKRPFPTNRISTPFSPNRISLCSKPDFPSEGAERKRPLDIRFPPLSPIRQRMNNRHLLTQLLRRRE